MSIVEFELSVPQRLSGIKLRQYQEYLKIQDKLEEGKESENFLNSKCIQIFCGVTLKESYNLPVKMFNGVLKQISNCFEEDTPLIRKFTMTGTDGASIDFGFIPDLENMTFGEYVDLDNFITDWQSMHKAMAVLYRPITFEKNGKYLIEDYKGDDKYWEIMKDAPVNITLGAMVFFYRLGKKLSKYTLLYLQQQAQKDSQGQNKDLEKNGVGINQYMRLLEEKYQTLVKSRKFHFTNA